MVRFLPYQKPMRYKTGICARHGILMRGAFGVLMIGVLAACGNDDQSIVERLGAGPEGGPDEFLVLPRKELELPEQLTELPTPNPGGPNRTDLTPERDVQIALSGREGRAAASASDTALLAATGANQRVENIRQILRQEDAEWRAQNRGRVLERIFLRDNEVVVYSDMLLDADAEYARLRARGVLVPAAPPLVEE